MTFATGLIITLLCVVALVAEVVLYFLMGLGIAATGDKNAVSGWAALSGWVFIQTLVAAVAAPVAGLIGDLSKRDNLATLIFLGAMTCSSLGACGLIGHSIYQQQQLASATATPSPTPTPTPAKQKRRQ